jgi:hypothetical protein
MFTYWEITQEKTQELSRQYGVEFSAMFFTIRVYDITGIDFDGSNANRYFDVTADKIIGNTYINVGEFNRSWRVDIGYVLAGGQFIIIARSNSLTLPHHGISKIIDERWALSEIDFKKICKLLGAQNIGANSYDTVKFMNDRWKEFENIPSSSISSLRNKRRLNFNESK